LDNELAEKLLVPGKADELSTYDPPADCPATGPIRLDLSGIGEGRVM
jgi:hypothetical protein